MLYFQFCCLVLKVVESLSRKVTLGQEGRCGGMSVDRYSLLTT